MDSKPYDNVAADQLILRDHLAADRTALANERTLLAYIRTALAFLITGASMIHFLTSPRTDLAGWGFILIGLLTALIGTVRFFQIQARISCLRKMSEKLG